MLFVRKKIKNMKALPSIYKKSYRCSGVNELLIGERCMFSFALQLTRDEFVPHKKLWEREEIYQGARCVVIERLDHVVRVRFKHSNQSDLVSPEFLILLEMTSFGEELFAKDPELFNTVENLTNMLEGVKKE